MIHRYAVIFAILLTLQGCAGFSTVDNPFKPSSGHLAGYSFLQGRNHGAKRDDITLILAFSGGGTRAAALSYGVLKALRDTSVALDGQPVRLLDEVDVISSVSGGSFTSAYYGLNGNGIFNDFETRFLRKDVSDDLFNLMLNPGSWFSSKARSEMAVSYYEKNLFKGARFKDLMDGGGPLIIINASDLGGGVRFSFLQDYFNLLCSDLSQFPVARAVTASSAVPILFSPVVLKNHPGCRSKEQTYLQGRNLSTLSAQMKQVVSGLQSYADKENRQFIHLVDGGITDNLGLMAIYEMIEVAGGAGSLARQFGQRAGNHIILISVNASTHTRHTIEASNQDPSIEDTINTMTDIQLHRYNAATLDLMDSSLKRWADEVSTPQNRVTPYFISLGFNSLNPADQDDVNRIPTSFTLSDSQVDRLISLGGQLLRANPQFRQFMDDIKP